MTSITISKINPSFVINLKSHETILIKGGVLALLDKTGLREELDSMIGAAMITEQMLEMSGDNTKKSGLLSMLSESVLPPSQTVPELPSSPLKKAMSLWHKPF